MGQLSDRRAIRRRRAAGLQAIDQQRAVRVHLDIEEYPPVRRVGQVVHERVGAPATGLAFIARDWRGAARGTAWALSTSIRSAGLSLSAPVSGARCSTRPWRVGKPSA